MSWMSPLTVPITTRPTRSAPVSTSSGRRMNMPGLHRVRGEQHLGHEQDAVAEVDADDPHALDERVVEDPLRAPAAAEEDVRPLGDRVREPVVEVVVHLLGELLIREAREVDVLEVFLRHPNSRCPSLVGGSTSWNGAV